MQSVHFGAFIWYLSCESYLLLPPSAPHRHQGRRDHLQYGNTWSPFCRKSSRMCQRCIFLAMGPAHNRNFYLKFLRRGLQGEPGSQSWQRSPRWHRWHTEEEDRLISQGVDIPTAMSLYQALNDGQSTVKFFYIQEQDVNDAVNEMPADLPEVPTKMRLYQVFTSLILHYSSLVKALWTVYDWSCLDKWLRLCSANRNMEDNCQKTKSFSFNSTDAHT